MFSMVLIIIIHIHHALINAVSAHMIHINLNTIFYTHVEHLPKQFTYKVLYGNAHTHERAHAHTYTCTQ